VRAKTQLRPPRPRTCLVESGRAKFGVCRPRSELWRSGSSRSERRVGVPSVAARPVRHLSSWTRASSGSTRVEASQCRCRVCRHRPLRSPRVQGPVLPCPLLTGVRAVLPVHGCRRGLGVRKQRVPLREATHPEQGRVGLGHPDAGLEWCRPSPRGPSPMPAALRQYTPRRRTLISVRVERATAGSVGTFTGAM
jgi:hypothetical protein